jgi:hypothetical protein
MRTMRYASFYPFYLFELGVIMRTFGVLKSMFIELSTANTKKAIVRVTLSLNGQWSIFELSCFV